MLPRLDCTGKRQGQRLVCVCDVLVLVHDVASSTQKPLGGQQALHPNRAPGVDAAGADAHLCAQPKSARRQAKASTRSGPYDVQQEQALDS